ncbi:MOLTING PROTEIN MLT-4 [Salix koriyanagi]|uniref:MOLTING PROTEIN MLT-4 n=1 Tax=Salix koriyanagi TaxID=2511006 RepID=A0A9Q0PWU1_9ROSI|nr:MOLTING PROTEIN MLT-4 [Salix koriyanagi]
MIDNQFYKCVRRDNIEDFKSRVLLQKHLIEKLVTPCGNTLLHVAVSYGSDEIIAYLTKEFPALITTQNSQEDTVLHLAAREGKAEEDTVPSHAIKSLVESNPSVVRMTNEKGNTPLHEAVIKGNGEFAIFLASKDPEVAYYNNKNGRSPLYLAVENGNKKGILDDLLKSKREDGDALPKGKSPVHAAIERRDIGILKKIVEAKPELLRLTDEELGNSLHYASSIGFLEGVQFLLRKFVDGAYERNSEGNYPIHIACKNDSVDVVKKYLDIFPYPKEFLNKKGQNILHVAAKYGNCNVISYILKQDPKLVEPLVNATDKFGNTPLHLAACFGRPMASFLLVRDNRVERFIVNNENWTPYDLAEQQSKIVEEEYDKRYEMTAVERQQLDSKKSIPADETKGKEAGSEEIAVNYFEAVMSLSILYFHACPKRSLSELFPVVKRPMSLRGEEMKSLLGNLLVAAVLVAGVTFAGAIQLPQLRESNNPGDIHHELNSTSRDSSHENLLYGYLFFDVGALSTSLMAALILLWSSFNDPKFQIHAVVFSTCLVFLAIILMFRGILFFCENSIARIPWWVLSSHHYSGGCHVFHLSGIPCSSLDESGLCPPNFSTTALALWLLHLLFPVYPQLVVAAS